MCTRLVTVQARFLRVYTFGHCTGEILACVHVWSLYRRDSCVCTRLVTVQARFLRVYTFGHCTGEILACEMNGLVKQKENGNRKQRMAEEQKRRRIGRGNLELSTLDSS